MKRLFLAVMSALWLASAGAEILGYVEQNGSWIYLYNESGKKYKTMSASSVGEVVGWGSSFFVSVSGSWVYLYDASGRRYKTLSKSSVGEVIGVSTSSFTTRSGSWIYTYNREGKRISTRSAR